MNKPELITAMANETGFSKKDAEIALNAFISTVSETLKNGEKIQLVGFGTFETVTREAHTGRNPHTGETIEIKAAKVPKFKPGKSLKDAVNG